MVEPTSRDREEVRRLTDNLRHSDEEQWPQLRKLLAERGFDSNDLALVTIWPEDRKLLLGYLVHRSGRVIFFEFDYLEGGQGDGFFRKWEPNAVLTPHDEGEDAGKFAAANELLSKEA